MEAESTDIRPKSSEPRAQPADIDCETDLSAGSSCDNQSDNHFVRWGVLNLEIGFNGGEGIRLFLKRYHTAKITIITAMRCYYPITYTS